MTDAVDHVIAQWERERPDLELAAMATMGRLGRVAAHLFPAVEATLTAHGLTTGEFDVLAALRRAGAPHQQTPSELAGALMLSPAAMTNRLDRLESAGLISRGPNPASRRSLLVSLTPEGLRVVDAAVTDHVANEEALLSALTPAQRRQFDDLLRRLLAAFEPPAG
jgi:DNA-binding MarR family transcriptional regulator